MPHPRTCRQFQAAPTRRNSVVLRPTTFLLPAITISEDDPLSGHEADGSQLVAVAEGVDHEDHRRW